MLLLLCWVCLITLWLFLGVFRGKLLFILVLLIIFLICLIFLDIYWLVFNQFVASLVVIV